MWKHLQKNKRQKRSGINHCHINKQLNKNFNSHTLAIQLNHIILFAVVGGNEVFNPFVVMKFCVGENNKWMLGSLSFTRLMTPDNT